MSEEPRTCAICGALITPNRGGELVRLPGHEDLVWVHPDCRGRQPQGNEDPATASREEMLRALQKDVNAWPGRVRDAGVTNAGGAAYVPLPRNNEILRTPDDPEATLAYMMRAWEAPDAEKGSEGWYRIISQVGPTLTWEWLIADETRPYATLFPDEIRARVRRALQADAGYAEWRQRSEDAAAEDHARAERVERIRDEIRAGTRERLSLPELDKGL
jgi:hypothetical protein